MKVALVAALAVAAMAAAAVTPAAAQITDVDILNFALNLEYLEAEFYLYAVTGRGIPSKDRGANGKKSIGGMKTHFTRKTVKRIAAEIAEDEYDHVKFLRAALSTSAVDMPKINIGSAFAAAANAALNTTLRPPFSPYRESEYDLLFLHGAFIFEDVGVTAYKGAAPLIADKGYLEYAAGILAVEAYHAGSIRTQLYQKADVKVRPYGVRVKDIVAAISALRAAVSGGNNDQGIVKDWGANITPTDNNGIAYSRTAFQVLPIVYLGGMSKGGFFPEGLNGKITAVPPPA